MNALASNLLFALNQAIISQQKAEKDHGFTGASALVAGWKDLYAHIQQGGQITIVHTTEGA
jgi:hypothetical protein